MRKELCLATLVFVPVLATQAQSSDVPGRDAASVADISSSSNHVIIDREPHSRTWAAPSLTKYLEWWLSGQLKL